VSARARPTRRSDIRFEVWLPLSRWNGRLAGAGNGGFAGYISYSPGLIEAVQAGEVGVSTDTGHIGAADDGAWAEHRPERLIDYGWRAVHLSTMAAKALIRRFYGRPVRYSYFDSCSNGGRQGLMEAWRFPTDYDGIIAGAAVWSWTSQALTQIWNEQSQARPGARISAPQANLMQAEVRRQCAVGAAGYLSDPRRCSFDVSHLSCGSTASRLCFTPAQIDALQRIYSGPRDASGRRLWFGFVPSGGEVGTMPNWGWDGWILRPESGQPASESAYPRAFLSSFQQTPFADIDHFDFDRDVRLLQISLASKVDVTPDLRRFFGRGGKLILWHGWADPAVPPDGSIEFRRRMAGYAGAAAVNRDSRLFMVPGVQHCFGGPGPNDFGAIASPSRAASPDRNLGAAIRSWVEGRRAPKYFIGSHVDFSSSQARAASEQAGERIYAEKPLSAARRRPAIGNAGL
jgi:feruloyl esterase